MNDNTELYRILALGSTAASSAEIKRQYRKLSLKHHPDRHSGSTELFQRVSHAHSVLSDPGRRRLYDSYGEAGLKLVEGSVGPLIPSDASGSDEGPPALERALALVCGIVGTGIVVLVAWSVLLALRADTRFAWLWSVVLLPLWLANLAMLVTAARARDRRAVLSIALLFVFELGAALKADLRLDAMPWLALAALLVLRECGVAWGALASPSPPDGGEARAYAAGHAVLALCSRTGTALLGAARLDGWHMPWAVVLAPLWFGFAAQLAMRAQELRSSVRTTAGSPKAVEAAQSAAAHVCAAACQALVAMPLVLLRLTGAVHSSLVLLAPMFAFAAVYLCCCAGVICFSHASLAAAAPVAVRGPYGPDGQESPLMPSSPLATPAGAGGSGSAAEASGANNERDPLLLARPSGALLCGSAANDTEAARAHRPSASDAV